MEIPDFAAFLIKNLLKNKRFYNTNNLQIKQIYANDTGTITTSPNNPNGSTVYLKGYLKGDINHNFESLYELVIKNKVYLIFTTSESLYYCENPGKYITYVNPLYMFCDLPNTIPVTLDVFDKIKYFQKLSIFSGRTYYLKGLEHFERAIKLKKTLPVENCHQGISVMVFLSISGSIYVFI